MRVTDYDPMCGELAEYFLADVEGPEADVSELAIAIQQAIEDWFSANPPGHAIKKAAEGR